jgi:hypothetical protein
MQNKGMFRGPAVVKFLHKQINFGVETHIEAPNEVALRTQTHDLCTNHAKV